MLRRSPACSSPLRRWWRTNPKRIRLHQSQRAGWTTDGNTTARPRGRAILDRVRSMSPKRTKSSAQTRIKLRQVTGRYASKFTPGGGEKRVTRPVPTLPKLQCLEGRNSRRTPVDQRVREYLIKAHNKVIAHYNQVLEARSLAQPERERIRERLAGIEAELAMIKGNSGLDPMRLVQTPPVDG